LFSHSVSEFPEILCNSALSLPEVIDIKEENHPCGTVGSKQEAQILHLSPLDDRLEPLLFKKVSKFMILPDGVFQPEPCPQQ
jgi:hypothetical protein